MKGCKDCPAFSKCIETYRGSGCAALRGTYGLDSDPEIITNADRIRAMSDEDLEVFLEGIYDVTEDGGGKIIEGNMIYPGDTLGWLQQPAEEEESDGH